MTHLRPIIIVVAATLLFAACSGGSREAVDPNVSGYPDTPFTIRSEKDLIGGPVAQGRVGDVLLKNDRIRVIIQKPRKNAGLNSFGGNIIDADLVRSGGSGQDNWGALFPLVNVEWTVNTTTYEVIAEGKDGGKKVLRARGTIDVYDYLDVDFIGDAAKGVAGVEIVFPNRFDDGRNPFEIYDDLRGLSREVTIDYTLEPGKNVVKIETTFTNNGEEDARFPVGVFINGSGQNSTLVPGVGFSPDLMTQIGTNTPAVLYAAYDGVDVSYGYFYDASQFADPETGEPYSSTSVSYSGITGLFFGEEFLKLTPLGGGDPEIHFSVPAGGSRTITGYFVVGDGSAGSVLDAGLAALGAMTRPVSGVVKTADGTPVAGATVAAMAKGATVVTWRTDANGRFAGTLPTGGNAASKRFGAGKYTMAVEVPGYHANGTSDAGTCGPKEIDLQTQPAARIECTLGESGTVRLAGPATDAETGAPVAARLTIVGEDPSPNKTGTAGRFHSTVEIGDLPFGIVDVRFVTAAGTVDLTGQPGFALEPGTYRFVFSRGPEYTSDERVVEVAAGKEAIIENVALARAVPTPGYVSGDFHTHSIVSPDSSLPREKRVLAAAADGFDVLQSSDHDLVVDHSDALSSLQTAGLVPAQSMRVIAGDEVTPNQYGHFNVFPLKADASDPEGGAFDWSDSDLEDVSPDPDFCWTLQQLIPGLRDLPTKPLVQLNHIMDMPTGLPLAAGWVTSAFYLKDFGVAPLSSYADPLGRRMSPRTDGGASFPIPYGASGLVTADFDVVELVIGFHLHDAAMFFRSALPTWFNFLNLGILATASSDSDSHDVTRNPIGLPRNYVAAAVDPRDGRGADFSSFDEGSYFDGIRAGRVTVSAGPIVFLQARSESGAVAEIGGTVGGRRVSFTADVRAPSWAWFDAIEIYANAEPIPADDDTGEPMQGTAADPAVFYKPYHAPVYVYEPAKAFRLRDGTLESWKEENGVITATVTFELAVTEDTWVVAVAKGTLGTEGFRSLFPIVTSALADTSKAPASFDPADLSSLHGDENIGASAWGFTNPIYIDADGDGKFTAKYVASGVSPIQ